MTETIAEVISNLFPGFTFDSTDMQLLLDYLKHEILGQLPDRRHLNMLPEVNVLDREAWELHSWFIHMFSSEKLFFFCQLKPKYQSSKRGNELLNMYFKQGIHILQKVTSSHLPGFGFNASAEVLLVHYLKPKILRQPDGRHYDMTPEIDVELVD